MRQPITTLAITLAGALLPTAGFAAITIADSLVVANNIGSTEDADGNDQTRTVTVGELGSFDANGVDKPVVALGGEGSGDNRVTSVTYGNVAMTRAIEAYGGNRGSSIWYLDNVSVTGTFVITHAVDQKTIGLAAYALNGTLADYSQIASTSQNTGTANYNTDMALAVTEGDFVVLSFARNDFDPSHDGSGGRADVKAPRNMEKGFATPFARHRQPHPWKYKSWRAVPVAGFFAMPGKPATGTALHYSIIDCASSKPSLSGALPFSENKVSQRLMPRLAM